jgi:hypothetical protein
MDSDKIKYFTSVLLVYIHNISFVDPKKKKNWNPNSDLALTLILDSDSDPDCL